MGKKCLLVVLCSLCVFSQPALGSGFADTYAFGVRALALGGAFTGVADDFSAAYYNPAGLAQIKGNRVNLEYLYTSPKIDVKTLDGQDLIIYTPAGTVENNPTEYKGGKGLDLKIPIIGLALDVNEIVNLPVHVELGVAISVPEKLDVAYRVMAYPADQPHLFRYGDDIDRVAAAVGIGVEVVKDLIYVGGGTQVMLYGDGQMYIDGLTTDVLAGNGSVVADAKMHTFLKADPLAGILFTPTVFDKKLKIGFSWRDEEQVVVDPVPALVSADLSGVLPGLGTLNLGMIMGLCGFYTPTEYSLGASYDLGPVMLTGEVNLQKWSNYDFDPSDSANDSTGQPYFEGDPGFDDTVNYRVGMEIKLDKDASVMLGYCHQPTPIPDQSGDVTTNYIDMDKDMISLGARYTMELPMLFYKPLTIQGVFQYQKLKGYTVTKDANVDGPTWTNQESYEVSGDAYAGGVSIGLAW